MRTTKQTSVPARRVVIAEDDTIIRMGLREQLEAAGFQVVGDVGDGESAIKIARELRPDVVVMDIRMPGLDGVAAARTLTSERIAPVVLVTAFAEPDLVERAVEAGVIAYVIKPLRNNDLETAIEIALSRYNEFLQIASTVEDLKEQLETRKAVERAKGLLMTKLGLTEPEAFKRIQRLSMDRRKSMREIAEAIILAEQV
ncbi:MAG: response regulator [Actinobacteria bacterium]|nr:response regulator [Actinomycetota bacterium]